MVIDRIENARLYFGISADIYKALKFLQTDEAAMLSPGKHDLDEGIFAIVSEYQTKSRSECNWETHRKYIDVQFLLEGCEAIDYAHAESLDSIGRYDSANDCQLYEGEGSELRLEPGSFAIFFPEDAHRPCIADGMSMNVSKIVVKVKVNK